MGGGNEREPVIEPDVRGRAWSGGSVFSAQPRLVRGTVCKKGDATGAARSTPRRPWEQQQARRRALRAYEAWSRVMGGRRNKKKKRGAAIIADVSRTHQ